MNINNRVDIAWSDLWSFTPNQQPSWCFALNGMVYLFCTGVSTSLLKTANMTGTGVSIADVYGLSMPSGCTLRGYATGEANGSIFALDLTNSNINEYHLSGSSYSSSESWLWRIMFPPFPVDYLSTTVRNKYGI